MYYPCFLIINYLQLINKTTLFICITFLLTRKREQFQQKAECGKDKETAGRRKKSAIFTTSYFSGQNPGTLAGHT